MNGLTERWTSTLAADESATLSGLGAWLLLSAALSGASGPAVAELEQAMDVSQDEAARSVAELHDRLVSIPGLRLGLGLWSTREAAARPEFVAALPDVHVGADPTQDDLDRWANESTDGLIDRFPGELDAETLMVLASVIVAGGTWRQRFDEVPGRWLGQPHADALYRQSATSAASVIRLGDDEVSRVVVAAEGSVEVHLLAGTPEAGPPSVLGAGFAALDGRATATPADTLPPGTTAGCVAVTTEQSPSPDPVLRLRLPRFEIRSGHDLLDHVDLFGLATATDLTRPEGHFAGISATPLAVGQAAQSAMMRFLAERFDAAAVTAIMMPAAAAMPVEQRTYDRLVVSATHDRPFGYLVVERTASLVLFAGWVGPDPASFAVA